MVHYFRFNMSFCTRDGEDKAVFLTEEDYEKPGMLYTLTIDEEEWGIILPTGDINWKCPCLGGIIQSPCGDEFKSAFSCFHYSEGEPKGIECIDSFKQFQNCVEKYPELLAGDEDVEESPRDDNSDPLMIGNLDADISNDTKIVSQDSSRRSLEHQ